MIEIIVTLVVVYFFLNRVPLKYQLILAILFALFIYSRYYTKFEDIPSIQQIITPKNEQIYQVNKSLEPNDIINKKISQLENGKIKEIIINSKPVGSFNIVEFIELIDYLILYQRIEEGKYYKCKYFVDYFMEMKNKIMNTYGSLIHSLPPPMDSKIYTLYHKNINELEKELNEQLARYSYKCQEISYQDITTDSYLSNDFLIAEKPANMIQDNRYQYYL